MMKFDAKTLMDFDELAEAVLDMIGEKMGFKRQGIFFYNEKEDGITVAKVDFPKFLIKFVEAATGLDFFNHTFKLSDNSSIVKAYRSKTIQQCDHIGEITDPFITGKKADTFNKLMAARTYICVPMMYKGDILGVLVFGRLDNKALTQDEQDFLNELSESLGFYLYNAWKVKMLKMDNNNLSQKVNDFDKLNDIRQDFLKKVYALLESIDDEFELSGEVKKDLVDNLMYIKSQYLLGEIVKK